MRKQLLLIGLIGIMLAVALWAATVNGSLGFTPILPPAVGPVPLLFVNSGTNQLNCLNPDSSSCLAATNTRAIGIVFDGGGAALGAETRCTIVDISGTITGFTMLSDVSGAATVDVQTVAYSSYTGPGSASSITDSHTPAMAGAVSYQDMTLTGWTTALSANTAVCFVLSSPATITWLNADLKVLASN